MNTGTHVVELPSSIKIHTLGNLLKQCSFFPSQTPQRILLRFHPRYSQFEPFGLAMLAAWGKYWLARGVEIHCENLDAKGVAYAQRLGLFRFIPAEPSTSIETHEEAGRFVDLQHIRRQADLTKLAGDLGGILKTPALIETVQYLVSELTRNVLEHAGADAFVCAQHYKKAGRVSLGIADCGRGVLESLNSSHNFETHERAIVAAMRPGVTRAVPTPYGSPDNAGLGLFYSRGLAKWTAQYFVLLSGDCAYRLQRKQRTRAPSRDPRHDGHDLFGNGGWQGTVVAIDIASVQEGHSAMLKAIGAAASPRDELSELKSRIRFT